ncbi:hypothetical protein E3N88_18641 [Mikania micrantha]|uniref:Uncharacterized protein n=1 Tax=Mikania micrantha TaxID=192012 RepID=A0A5N6NNE4_9ASTR|nr:hypothetical protein E3N88_18641 [Mikania micrantha]
MKLGCDKSKLRCYNFDQLRHFARKCKMPKARKVAEKKSDEFAGAGTSKELKTIAECRRSGGLAAESLDSNNPLVSSQRTRQCNPQRPPWWWSGSIWRRPPSEPAQLPVQLTFFFAPVATKPLRSSPPPTQNQHHASIHALVCVPAHDAKTSLVLSFWLRFRQ